MRFSIYGIPQLAMSTTEVFLRLYLLVYFTQVIKFTAQEGALIISGSLIISALFDPFIGKFGDHFKDTKGRLTPVITCALFLLTAILLMLFLPHWSTDDFIIVFTLTTLYQMTYSLFLIPYLAMAKTLIKKENDIINLYSWRYVWGSIGALGGVSLPFLLKYLKMDTYEPIGLTMAALILALGPSALYFLKEDKFIFEKPKTSLDKEKVSLRIEFDYLFKNKPFMIYITAFTILSVGLGINQTLAVYFYKEGLNLSSDQVNKLLIFYMFIFSLSIPFWANFSKKKGKRNSLRLGLIVVCICTFLYPLIPQNNLIFLYLLITIAGFFTGVVVLVDAYLSNIIDYHNFKRNIKKSNFIFSLWRIIDKSSRAIGIYIAGIILDHTMNEESPLFTINQAFGYGVLIFVFIATVLLFIQKFNERHHKIVIKFLNKKKPWLANKALDQIS